jgi:hypothetical protein
MWVDLFPGHNENDLSSFILGQAALHGSRQVRTFLQRCPIAPGILDIPDGDAEGSVATIPNVFADEILRQAEIEAGITMSGLTRPQRQRLVAVLKRLLLGTVRKIPLDRAEVSAGGVSLGEIDSKTMQSRIHPRLYCCGELLDYAGEVGGFNLQAAFSTGWMAGMHAARTLLSNSRSVQTAHE